MHAVGDSTNERSNSMWADTGVTTMARCVGEQIGPRAERL